MSESDVATSEAPAPIGPGDPKEALSTGWRGRSVRVKLRQLMEPIPRWSSWDSQQWDNGVHRRDPWL